jgi:hypothetical protein
VPELPWSRSCQSHHGPAGTLDNLICRRFTLFKLRSPTQTSDRWICRCLSVMRERKDTRSRIPKYPTTTCSEIRGSSRCWRKLGLRDPSSKPNLLLSQPRMSFVLAVCLSLDSPTGYGGAADIFWYSSGFWVKQKIVCLSVCLSVALLLY